jgi:hypothetical protein
LNDKKYRYGAWYLPKELWCLMDSNQKLKDPNANKDTEILLAKKKDEEIVRFVVYLAI